MLGNGTMDNLFQQLMKPHHTLMNSPKKQPSKQYQDWTPHSEEPIFFLWLAAVRLHCNGIYKSSYLRPTKYLLHHSFEYLIPFLRHFKQHSSHTWLSARYKCSSKLMPISILNQRHHAEKTKNLIFISCDQCLQFGNKLPLFITLFFSCFLFFTKLFSTSLSKWHCMLSHFYFFLAQHRTRYI